MMQALGKAGRHEMIGPVLSHKVATRASDELTGRARVDLETTSGKPVDFL